MRRIVSGLSRSLSPEAVVDTVISDLRSATEADHVVVARVRQPDGHVEVTLVAARADAPPSRTTLRPELESPASPTAGAVDEGVGESAGGPRTRPWPPPRRSRGACARPTVCPTRWRRRSSPSGASWGPCCWRDAAGDAWSEGDRRLLSWAAGEVATAFTRAYALEAAERGRQDRRPDRPAQPALLRRGPGHGAPAPSHR